MYHPPFFGPCPLLFDFLGSLLALLLLAFMSFCILIHQSDDLVDQVSNDEDGEGDANDRTPKHRI